MLMPFIQQFPLSTARMNPQFLSMLSNQQSKRQQPRSAGSCRASILASGGREG